MVNLTKESPLASMPAELQLHILSFLDYREVVQFKHVCRYFNYFISEDVLRECKENQIAAFHHMEDTRTLPQNMLACYTCLNLKPSSEFYSITGNYYLNAAPSNGLYPTTQSAHLAAATSTKYYEERYCIRCGFNDCKFSFGLRLTTQGRSLMYCSGCGVLDDQPAHATAYTDTCCRPCKKEYDFLREHGSTARLFQWIFSIIVLALACTGQAMPWTSQANKHSLRWIFTVFVVSFPWIHTTSTCSNIEQCFLTISGTMISMCSRMQTTTSATFKLKRSENGRFVFPIEIPAMLAWAGVLATLFNEGAHRDFSGRYDRFARALTAMTCLEL